MNVGEIFKNKYKIISEIGKSGISNVYLAIDVNTELLWTIKEYNKTEHENNDIYYHMIAEAKMVSKLCHPSIPRILDIIDTDKNLIIIMDYIEGKTIDRIIQESNPFSEELTINFAKQLIDVFCYIHSNNIIHRDLKPANVILRRNNKIALINFGIAKKFSPQEEKDTLCLGTRGYAAPEQYGGRGQTDFRTDIYGFGLTLFYMLTGISPINNNSTLFSIRKFQSNFSYALDFIIIKCTQPNPDDRYQTFEKVYYDFLNIETIEKILKRKNWISNIFKIKHKKSKQIKLNSSYYPTISSIQSIGETVILSDNNIDIPVPPSVMDIQKMHIFMSYCHNDNDLADIIYEKISQFSFISISRYTTDVPYKGSFKEFMNTLGKHDKVIMIISDQYLKSRACMYEVGQLINLPNFQNKILFVVCSNEDKKYYKSYPKEDIEAKIYDPHERNNYIIFWEKQCKLLKRDLDLIEDDIAKIEPLEVIRDIKKIISSDMGLFMKYIADVNGISFDELFKHNFKEFFDELGINEKTREYETFSVNKY